MIMRAFAAAWPDRAIVQEPLARITWCHNIALLERLIGSEERLWYARKVLEHGWSHNILVLQIQGRARERSGKTITNFPATLPPSDSDMAGQIFKDPYLFDILGTADPRREREVEQALVNHIHAFGPRNERSIPVHGRGAGRGTGGPATGAT
jgi:predicted nuclease of restriction endonuclease-like (RecB) superfamily